jgi:aminopeptidase N
MVSTDSWPDEAHHWIPCYDYPNDKVTHELIVTVPEGDRVLSNGRFAGMVHDKQSATATWHWSQELPSPTYLMMLAIGPFEVIEDSLDSLPVNYWVYPGDVEDARWIFEKTPRMLRFYSDLFQYEYPWAKYDQVTTPRVGGGAEATSATVLGQGVIHDRRAEQDFSWESVIAHEIAHQWWGDLITLREWSHTWLNESFGTYSDYLWTRSEKGEDEGAWDLLGKKNQYLREARTRYMRPIVFNRYDRPHDNFDSHTYPKGAAVLHMLRFVLGDEPFFRTLSYFLHEHEFQPVDTHDFQKAIKKVTGQNLDWFFEQFLFRPGHPVFDISYTWIEEEETVRLRIEQKQDTSKDVPIYTLPVIIGIVTSEGKATQKVWITEQEEVFTFHVDEKPLLVRFDEGNHLLKEWTFNKSIEELLYQFENDDVIGREWAASRLSSHAGDAVVETALLKGSYSDTFWAVRLRAVNTLGSFSDRRYTEDLKRFAEDNSSRVRTAALRILGDYRLDDLTGFFRERFESDDSYLVQAEALRSIGKCGDNMQLPFLVNAATMISPRDVIRRAAEWAIEELKKN